MELEDKNLSLLELTVKVVSSHISNNTVSPDQLPDLIRQVYQTLNTIDKNGSDTEKLQPVVPIKRSVFPDYIVCLEDGKKLKMLKRHIQSAYGLTPEQYRERWNLPADYPMVAPNYAERRSSLAREIGLGRKNVTSSKGEVRRQKGRKED